MTRKGRRVTLLVSSISVLTVAIALVLVAMQDTIVFFYSPSDLTSKHPELGATLRLGGLVEMDSVVHKPDNVIEFKVTDNAESILVRYSGIVPDLFREGQGVVAQGQLLSSDLFIADQILAKHDENYMPREVSEALKKTGRWQGEDETP